MCDLEELMEKDKGLICDLSAIRAVEVHAVT